MAKGVEENLMCPNNDSLGYRRIYASLGLNELNILERDLQIRAVIGDAILQ